MSKYTNDSKSDYNEFFKSQLYDGFVHYLIDKFGAGKVIAITGDEPIITKKGVQIQLRKSFNEFLNRNPSIEKKFVQGGQKFITQRNSCGGTLYFPINGNDDDLMRRIKLRVPLFIPVTDDIPRAGKKIKQASERMKKQTIRGDWRDHKYLAPTLFTIHFKRGYAYQMRKTTESFRVNSRQEVMTLLFEVYENKVAFAQVQNGERFQFVKRNDRKNKKLYNKV